MNRLEPLRDRAFIVLCAVATLPRSVGEVCDSLQLLRSNVSQLSWRCATVNGSTPPGTRTASSTQRPIPGSLDAVDVLCNVMNDVLACRQALRTRTPAESRER